MPHNGLGNEYRHKSCDYAALLQSPTKQRLTTFLAAGSPQIPAAVPHYRNLEGKHKKERVKKAHYGYLLQLQEYGGKPVSPSSFSAFAYRPAGQG